MRRLVLAAVAVAFAVWAPGVAGQTLAGRLRQAEDGQAFFTYPAKEGIYTCGRGERGWDRGGGPLRPGCWTGPVEVRLRIEAGTVQRLRSGIADPERAPSGVDLGSYGGAEAAEWMLTLAEVAEEEVAEQALGAAAMAADTEIWPRLLELARDGARGQQLRKQAVFWLGQEASDRVLEGLGALAREDPELEVRKAAVFALSRRTPDESFPVLRDLALSDADPALRADALFWLAQMDDPRVLELFERVLRP
ncbi:MAG: HEAT repeat domain-containing protein [Gemmatimonadota bacterium]